MYKQGKFYAFATTSYLYATVIVDLYRKLVGTNVESVRNIVYFFSFMLLFYDMIRTKRLQSMFTILIVSLLIFGFSIAINPGYSTVYSSAILLFISRMWPAYYIGRYTEVWNILCKFVLLFSPIAFAYAVSLFIVPDLAGGSAYATIASNLAIVTMISLYACFYYKKKLLLPIVVACLIPVFFYGTRAFFLGVLISLFLAYIININNVSPVKKIFLFTTLVVVVAFLLICSDVIFSKLNQWFPDSRTLNMMVAGDLMDDSNRSSFYDSIFAHLEEKPFSMLGFIGDRIYLSSQGADVSEILSNFSHNCSLELCMHFGVPIGIILNIYFIVKLATALKRSFLVQYTINYVYVLILGVCFLNMMVSASYISEYYVWLLFGLAFNICSKSFYSKDLSTYNE